MKIHRLLVSAFLLVFCVGLSVQVNAVTVGFDDVMLAEGDGTLIDGDCLIHTKSAGEYNLNRPSNTIDSGHPIQRKPATFCGALKSVADLVN